MMEFVVNGLQKIVGRVVNAGFQHFLLFPLCFQSPLYMGRYNSVLCDKELNAYTERVKFVSFQVHVGSRNTSTNF